MITIFGFFVGMLIGWYVFYVVIEGHVPTWAQRWWQKLKDIVKKNIKNK
jgi:hypothetical protein